MGKDDTLQRHGKRRNAFHDSSIARVEGRLPRAEGLTAHTGAYVVLRLMIVCLTSRRYLQTPSCEEDVDYVLLGAGMSGIFMLAEALQQGFKSVVVIDRKDR